MSDNEVEENLIDIDNDGVNELVQVIEDYPGMINIWTVNSDKKIVSLDAYNKKDGSVIQLSDYYFRIHKAKEKNTNDEKYFLSMYTGDGLCYEILSVYALQKEGNKIILDGLFEYSCDEEVEERLRAEILSDTTLTTEEALTKMTAAHTVEYEVNGAETSEEKYNEYVNLLKERYELIKVINEN